MHVIGLTRARHYKELTEQQDHADDHANDHRTVCLNTIYHWLLVDVTESTLHVGRTSTGVAKIFVVDV